MVAGGFVRSAASLPHSPNCAVPTTVRRRASLAHVKTICLQKHIENGSGVRTFAIEILYKGGRLCSSRPQVLALAPSLALHRFGNPELLIANFGTCQLWKGFNIATPVATLAYGGITKLRCHRGGGC